MMGLSPNDSRTSLTRFDSLFYYSHISGSYYSAFRILNFHHTQFSGLIRSSKSLHSYPYGQFRRGGRFHAAVIVQKKNPRTSNKDSIKFEPDPPLDMETLNEAKHWAATYALYRVSSPFISIPAISSPQYPIPSSL